MPKLKEKVDLKCANNLALTNEQIILSKILREEIKLFCEQNAKEVVIKKYSRYFKKNEYDAFGVEPTLINSKVKEILEKYKDELKLNVFLYLGDLLLKDGRFEEKSFALTFIDDKDLKKGYSINTFKHIGNWLDNYIDNWAHDDFLCSRIISYFIKEKIVDLKDFSNWRKALSKWKRRAVPVSMINYLKKYGVKPEYLTFIEPLMIDNERVVHQGLGWFLREAWKRDNDIIESFLFKWKNISPRLIFQYATEKMDPEKKKLFKKEKY